MNHLNKNDLDQILDSKDKFFYCFDHQILFKKNPSKFSRETLLDYVVLGYVKNKDIVESKHINYCKCSLKGVCKYYWFG